MRIFIAGSSGQLALSLIKAANNNSITTLAAEPPEFDLLDHASMQDTIGIFKPTAIVNAAAYTAVDAAEDNEETATRINADGAAALATITKKLDIPFIHVSTDYVFDGTKAGSYSEADPANPTGAYGRSKLAGEQAVMAANANSIILRTAWVFSPYGKNFCKTMLMLAKNRPELGVVADQMGNPTYAPDIADAILQILGHTEKTGKKSNHAGLYHLAGTGDTSWHGFASEIFSLGGKHGHPVPTVKALSTEEYPTPAKRPQNSCLDCTKLYTTFGIKLPAWQESTAKCVKQLLENEDLG